MKVLEAMFSVAGILSVLSATPTFLIEQNLIHDRNSNDAASTIDAVEKRFNTTLFLSNSSLYIFRNSNDEPIEHENHENHEPKIDSFYKELQAFLYETVFDVAGFEKHMLDLKQRFFDLEFSVQLEKFSIQISGLGDFKERNSSSGYKAPLDKLKYTKFMLQEMVNLLRSLHSFNKLGDLGQHLVRCLIHFNVMLLSLRNSSGGPDPLVENFAEIIALHIEYLRFWKSLFSKLRSEPYNVSHKFSELSMRAENTLKVLSRQ